MSAKSKKQQSAFGMALAARRGDIPPESLKGAARKLYKDSSLSDNQIADYTKKTEIAKKVKHFSGKKPNIRARS